MAVTTVLNGSIVSSAEEASGTWEGYKGGGSTPSVGFQETESYIQGSYSVSTKISGASGAPKGMWADITVGGSTIDLTGAQAGYHMIIWVLVTTAGGVNTRANGGIELRAGSSLTDFRTWYVAGNDKGYPGGWYPFIIDLNSAGSIADSGTYDNTAVRYFGAGLTMVGTAKAPNLFIDQIVVGKGLRVYGTSTTDDLWGDILADDEGTIGNRWGFLTSRSGVIFTNGEIKLGDDVGTNASVLTSKNAVVVWEKRQVEANGGGDQLATSSTFHKLLRVGNNTNGTDLDIGAIVGSGDTAKGRNGDLYMAEDGASALQFDLDDVHTGSNADADLFGCTFINFQGTFVLSVDTDHQFIGNTVQNCSQVTGAGGIKIRGCTFSGHTGTDAAVYWADSGMDMKNCNFFANTDGTNDPAGIEHGIGGSVSYYAIKMADNDYAIYLSHASQSLTVNADANCSGLTPNRAPGSGTITVVSSVTITVNAKDKDNNPLTDVRIILEASAGDDLPSYESVTITSVGTLATVTHTAHGMNSNEYIIIRGANEQDYNGIFQITVNTVDEYEYTMSGDPSSPATGTITATARIMQELTVAGLAQEPHRYTSDQVIQGFARKGSASPFFKIQPLGGTITGTGVTITAQMVDDE